MPEPINDYILYGKADFNHPDYFPIHQTVSTELYRPAAVWMGRMILPAPEQRRTVKGTLFEIYHADEPNQHLVGKVVNLRWDDDPEVQVRVWSVTKDVHFNDKVAESKKQGLIHPDRFNNWRLVNPLESLAGSLPDDIIIVALREPVRVEERDGETSLYIRREPIQVTGRFLGLVSFLPLTDSSGDKFRVAHFNRDSKQFDGPEEVVRLPQVVKNIFDYYPSTTHKIDKSPLNSDGWYIYGAQDHNGMFVVQSLAPRALFHLQPQEVILEKDAALTFIKKGVWKDAASQGGKIVSVLLSPQTKNSQEAITRWEEGDHALLVSAYGGIGGKRQEPNAGIGGIYFGHFAYGTAKVIHEPLADELRFDIEYHQVFTSNAYGLVAGTMHWSRYMGDRQRGFLGLRPVADILLKLDAFTEDYEIYDRRHSVLEMLAWTLETMTARYRIGDGTGGTYMTAANNCAQDSNQSLYAVIKNFDNTIKTRDWVQDWLKDYPDQVDRFEQLLNVGEALKGKLLPFGSARSDWDYKIENLGSSLQDSPVAGFLRGLRSWRAILPCVAARTIAGVFVKHGASAWVLRTNQCGGSEPDIEPLSPFPC